MIKHFLKDTSYFFGFLAVLTVPFPLYLFPFHETLIQRLFGGTLSFIARAVFSISLHQPLLSSDSTLMYLLMLGLLILTVMWTVLLSLFPGWPSQRPFYFAIFHRVFAWYLAFQMINYGFDKLLKGQFPIPEPNILYTPLGNLSKDLLFWSTMGVSYPYNIFMGLAETVSGLLLLFRKTRTLGALLTFGVLLNIVAINFSFDISVKVYSVLLCFLSILLFLPQLPALYAFFILQKNAQLSSVTRQFSPVFPTPFYISFKTLLVGFLFLEVLFPFLQTGNFNDDLAERSSLHGAYKVIEVSQGLKEISVHSSPVRRFFVHRHGFIIFEDQQGNMQDYALKINPSKGVLQLTDYAQKTRTLPYHFDKEKFVLQVTYFHKGKKYLLQTKAVDWRKLPALQDDFHWTIDGGF